MLRVEDIMTKKVYLVDFAASAEAAWGLKRRAPPVYIVEGDLEGMLTDGDLVDPAPFDWIKGEATVGDLTDPEVTVYENDPALAAAHEMATRNLTQVIVINTNNQLVGMVSAMDLVRAIDKGAFLRSR